MMTSSNNFQTERKAIAREYAHLPKDQQSLLALLSEQSPPPADESTPPLPSDLLDQLKSRFGSVMEAPAQETAQPAVTRRAVVRPGLLQTVRGWFAMPAMQWGGLATACVAIVLGVMYLRPPDKVDITSPPDTWRGNTTGVPLSGDVFIWVGTDADAARAAVADKVPDLANAATGPDAATVSRSNPQAIIYVMDPAAGSVSAMINGELKGTQEIKPGTPEKQAEAMLDALRKAQRKLVP